MRVANLLAGILFVVAALLQLNDPDPVQWFTLYALAAAACWIAPAAPSRWILAAAVGASALIWAGLLAPHVFPSLDFANLLRAKDPAVPAIEETREITGLFIVAAWMGVRVLTLARFRA